MTDFKQGLNHSLHVKLNLLKDKLELTGIEISALKSPITIEFYEKWLADGFHADMVYLKNHLKFKKDPRLLGSELKSVISISQSYFPEVKKFDSLPPARIALYARNEDYHFWLKQKLSVIISELKKDFPNELFTAFVDSGPILERELAFQNRLGWFGKNTCLINPEHGSLFFIAEILTSIDVQSNNTDFEPIPDFCGKCQKCIEICPTEALVAPRTLNAAKCISYLTIESKKTPPVELRNKIGDWFFGCDLCQTVCPWNEKSFRKRGIEKSDLTNTKNLLEYSDDNRKDLVNYFKFLLESSNNKILKSLKGSPLTRPGAKGLKRNALIVIANQKLTELRGEVENLKSDELQELVRWTLKHLED